MATPPDEPECEFDGPWKEAIEWYFPPFLEFFFPAVHAGIDWDRGHEFLDKELEKIAPEAATGRGTVDKLAKVWRPTGEEAWVLIHVEVQNQPVADFARRMFGYNTRLTDRYGRMPVSLAVFGDDRVGWQPDEFRAGEWGCEVAFRFPSVKLLELRNRDPGLETDPNPFAAVTLAHLKTLDTRGDPDARQHWKFSLVKGLYDRGFDRERIVRLYRLIDWIMRLSPPRQWQFAGDVDALERARTMPFISPTEEIWMLKGQFVAIEAILEGRFGAEGVALMPRVRALMDAAAIKKLTRVSVSAPDLDSVRSLLDELGV